MRKPNFCLFFQRQLQMSLCLLVYRGETRESREDGERSSLRHVGPESRQGEGLHREARQGRGGRSCPQSR